MRTEPLHPQKPAQIEHVTDDIRALKRPANDQQRTLLSARAIADRLAGDRFVRDDADSQFDNKYFTKDSNDVWKVDFDKVTTAQIRYADNGYLNGPDRVAFNGFLHVAAVLPSGKLLFDTDEDGKVIDCRREADRESSVRQIFYPIDHINFESFTRIGTTEDGGVTWKWSRWVPLSGKLLRILVPNTEAGVAILKTPVLRTGVIYELHCGGQIIRLPNADSLPAGETVIFEQYSNGEAVYVDAQVDTHAEILPIPSKERRYFVKRNGVFTPAGSNNGWLTEFERYAPDGSYEVYYFQEAPSAWSNVVEYTERVKNEGKIESRTYTTDMIPGLDTIRTSQTAINNGIWYENSEQCIQYKYEVIDREEPVAGSNLTWMLDLDPEATSRMADMAELLDAHTDRALTDFVLYRQRQFRGAAGDPSDHGNISPQNADNDFFPRNNEPLVISKILSMAGVAKVKMVGNTSQTNWKSQLDGLVIKIFKYNDKSSTFGHDVGFEYQSDDSVTPNPYKKYYVKDTNGLFVLAGADGYFTEFPYTATNDPTPINGKHYYKYVNNVLVDAGHYEGGVYHSITEFESGVTYYERIVYYTRIVRTASITLAPAKITFGDDVVKDALPDAVFFSDNPNDFFRLGGDYWNSHDEMTGYIKCARNDTLMIVLESEKGSFRHTNVMQYLSPIVEFYPDPHDSYILKENINPRAITDEELAATPHPGSVGDMVASAKALTRAYQFLAETLQTKGFLFGSTALKTDTLGTIHNLDEIKTAGIYTFADTTVANRPTQMRAGGQSAVCGNGTSETLLVWDSTSFGSNDYLGNKGDTSNKNRHQISQLFIGCEGSVAQMWMRTGIATTTGDNPAKDASHTWTPWIQLQAGPCVREHVNVSEIAASTIEEDLKYGYPCVVVGGNKTDVTVNLPDPSKYVNARFQIEAWKCALHIKYTVGGTTYVYDSTSTKPETGDNDQTRMLYPIENDGVRWFVVTVK